MEIPLERSTLPTRVTIKLDFLRPFEGHNTAEFSSVSSRKGRRDRGDLVDARPEQVHDQGS